MSQYTTGTVTVNNGSPTVTGTGTTWTGNVAAGDLFHVPGDAVGTVIQSVDSTTQVTLVSNYAGTTGSGKAYRITTSRTANFDFPFPEAAAGGPGDSDTATIVKQAFTKLDALLSGTGSAITLPSSSNIGTATGTSLTLSGALTAGASSLGALSTSGNISVGVSGSAWNTALKVVEYGYAGSSVVSGGAGDSSLTSALYFNQSNNFVYANSTTGVGIYNISSGVHSWKSAASGTTGGTISLVDLLALSVAGHLTPGADNTQNFGSASLGWKEIFADNGTINTSDARKKTAVQPLSPAHLAAAQAMKAEVGWFQFLSAVAEKGAEGARHHIGLTVQRAIEILQANGLPAYQQSFICHDEWDDEFVDHPAIEAADAVEAAPAEYEEAVREVVVIINGKRVPVQQPYLREIKPAVEARPAIEAAPAWREQVQVAGDRYGFRVHELLLFFAAADEARFKDIEARLTALES